MEKKFNLDNDLGGHIFVRNVKEMHLADFP